jgi:CRP-like cAMP-binding protein
MNAAAASFAESLPELVARSALMRGASAAALEQLRRSRLKLRALTSGECVFRQGDAVDAVYLLLGARPGGDGLDVDPLVQLELKPDAGKRGLRFERIVHGEIFGELELLEQGLAPQGAKRTTSAFALTPASVVPLPLALLADLIERDAILRGRLIRIGSQRLLAALKQQHDKSHAYPDLLLADWLVELAADNGIAEGNRVRFPRKIAQSDIAADLGVSRETISRRLNEWERSGLLRTGARSQQIEILDYQRISRLASLRTSRNRAALERTVADIDAAIACGDLIRARNIGLDILRYYPSSPELHHRTALAAARGGDAEGALDLLSRSGLPLEGNVGALEEAVRKARKNPFLPMDRILADPFVDDGFGEDEPEEPPRGSNSEPATQSEAQLVEDLAALNARLLKEHAFAGAGARLPERARASFAAYHRLFEARQGYYPGVNAATMALVAGDTERARAIAAHLIATLDPDADDYWPLATLGEALLIAGRKDDAVRALAKAGVARGADDGAKATTMLQLTRLAPLIDAELDPLIAALSPRNVAVVSGHLFRGNELDEAAQQATEAEIHTRADALLAEHNVGSLYGALAAGSDIVIAEAALEAGAEFHCVLPFPMEAFIESSVRIGDPPGYEGKWETRLRAILDGRLGPSSLTVMEPSEPPERDLDGTFFYAFRYAAGEALQRAATLQTRCRLIVVSDEAEADTIAGANQVLIDWRAHDRAYDIIPYPHKRSPRPHRKRPESAFRPVVFLWDAAPDETQGEGPLDRLFSAVASSLPRAERTHRDGRRGCCLLTGSTEETLGVALEAVDASRAAGHPLRVVCDFGLVLGADHALDKKLVARLQSADDLPGLPAERVLATQAFAAQIKFDHGDRVALVPVGRTQAGAAADEGERQAIRSRPSLPIYTIAWVAA